MAQKTLSIYIGSDVVKIAEVVRNTAKSVTINQTIQMDTPLRCVEDGMIVDVAKLAEALKNTISSTKFTTNKVVYTIASKKIATKEIVLPYMRNKNKIQEIILNNAPDYFPMSNVQDYVFTYSILETFELKGVKKYRIIAIASPKEIVEAYYALAQELGLSVENIDYYGNSISTLLSLQMKDNNCLVVHMEKETTIVNIMYGKTVILQRMIPYGENAIISSLMDVKGISKEEAGRILYSEALLDQEVTVDEYVEAVRYLIGNIARIVEYYRNQQNTLPIDEIKLCGEGSFIVGLNALLEQELGTAVSEMDELVGVTTKSSHKLTNAEILPFIASIGAVLKPVELKLLTGKEEEEKSQRDEFKFLMIGLVVATVVSVGISVFGVANYKVQENKNKKLTESIKAVQDVEIIYNQYMSGLYENTSLKALDKATTNQSDYLYDFILELELSQPSNTAFTSLTVADGALALVGTTFNKDEVAELVIQLKKCEFVKNVYISSIVDTYDAENPTARKTDFTLSCNLQEPAAGETENMVSEGGE